MMMFKWEKGKN